MKEKGAVKLVNFVPRGYILGISVLCRPDLKINIFKEIKKLGCIIESIEKIRITIMPMAVAAGADNNLALLECYCTFT